MENTGIDLGGISRIENCIFGYGKGLARAFIRRKMEIAILESLDCLVMLGSVWGIEDTGIFFCNDNFVPQVDLHGRLELEKKIISASCGAVNGVVVVIKAVVFTEIQLVHIFLPSCVIKKRVPDIWCGNFVFLFFSLPYDRRKSQMKRKK